MKAAKIPWKPGHKIQLLENGEAFFPRVFESIRAARQEILLETFILFQDEVGNELQRLLVDAAKRGVRVELTVDSYGSPDLTPDFIGALTAAGAKFHVFDPRPKLLGMRTNILRRLHRKLIVIDRERAFVGGINFSVDHLIKSGPEAKQDYAVEIEGPVVEDIRLFMESVLAGGPLRRAGAPPRHAVLPQQVRGDSASVMFVTRDNNGHKTDIEQHYRQALRSAKREVVIANAYFFPGFRLLRELRRAARRGVRIVLILQGQPDMPIVKWSAGMLYNHLLKAGVEIHEYCQRPLHGKVAIVDESWSTVGSSNLDPFSLSLNLESNVFIIDRAFNRHLRERLDDLIQHHCRQIQPQHLPPRTGVQIAMSFIAFHFMRYFPSWVRWMPVHKPRIETITTAEIDAAERKVSAMGGSVREHESMTT